MIFIQSVDVDDHDHDQWLAHAVDGDDRGEEEEEAGHNHEQQLTQHLKYEPISSEFINLRFEIYLFQSISLKCIIF